MKIEKKYMSKDSWRRVIKREYVYMNINEKDLQGEASLLKIKQISSPLYRKYGEKEIKLADSGYFWLQIALENKNYWITAMYDENSNLIQYYIDITMKNEICYNGNSYFFDLFLDVVKLKDGEIILLDKDELEKALEEECINKEQYELAYKVSKSLIDKMKSNTNELDIICRKYFEKIKSKIYV